MVCLSRDTCYLELKSDKDLKFNMNNFSYFEISAACQTFEIKVGGSYYGKYGIFISKNNIGLLVSNFWSKFHIFMTFVRVFI